MLRELQLNSRLAGGKNDTNASIKIFRSLLPSLPSLRPIFQKVVALAAKSDLVGDSAVPCGTALFEAVPPAVFFVGFESAEVYQAQFKLRLAWLHRVIPVSSFVGKSGF